MGNKCNDCKHKSEEEVYCLRICITCKHNPYVISDRFDEREVKIIPQEAGELWRNDRGDYYVTDVPLPLGMSTGLALFGYSGCVQSHEVIHGNGWTRLSPSVEEDIERIEIENVTWGHPASGDVFPNIHNIYDLRLTSKPPMKMILEIPKEAHECQD